MRKTFLSLVTALSCALASSVATAQAGKPLKIGFISTLSGVYAQVGFDQRDGMLMAIREAGSRVAGRPIELVVEDGEAKPPVGLAKARKLVEQDGVDMLAGVVSSGVAYALKSYIVEKKIPLMITNAGADGLTQRDASPYIFRVSFSGSQHGHPFGEWLYTKKGYRRMVIVGADYAAGYEHIGAVARTFKQAGGEVVAEVWTPLGTSDYAPYISEISRSGKADVVAAFLAGTDAIRFITQYNDFGMMKRVPLVGINGLVDELVMNAIGDKANGIVTAWGYSSYLDNPENLKFVADFQKQFGRRPTAYAEYPYVGMKMFLAALERTKGNLQDVQALRNAIAGVGEIAAPRGPFRMDSNMNPIMNSYVFETTGSGKQVSQKVIETFPRVSQFWKWDPATYMKGPLYGEMKGKWTQK
jgi:branched-chain amino acid transport system substrate-binding protein